MFFPLIVLDIDNNIEFSNLATSSATFLYQKAFHRTAWPKGRTAIVFLPHKGRQCPAIVEEIFFGLGEQDSSSLPAMRIFDTNKDSVIDGRDEFYPHLKVWINKKGDGICRDEDVFSLSTFGISINLDFEDAYRRVPDSHIIKHSFTYSIDYYGKNDKHVLKNGLSGYEVLLESRVVE